MTAPADRLLPAFLLGLLSAAAITGIGWWFIGHPPAWWTLLIGTELLTLATLLGVQARGEYSRHRIRRGLRERYHGPKPR